MNTFEAGTRVRIAPEYAAQANTGDGSMEAIVGQEGVVQQITHNGSDYVPVKLDGEDFPWLFLPEELETL